MSATQSADCGCFSVIFRRLLCAGSLQTHPSDQIAESNTCECDHAKKDLEREAKIQASETKRVVVDTPAIAPGVVARLMGLDSLPDTKWVPREKRVPDSVTRSRSVNFMDYFLELDLGQSKHRRIRKSVSFREVPTSFQQDQDLLVLYSGSVEETEEVGAKLKKCEEGLRKERQRDEEKRKNKENLPEIMIKKKKKKENQLNNSTKISALKNEPRRPVSNKHFSKADGITKAKSSLKSINQKDKYVDSKKMTMKKKEKKENLAVNNEECHSECSSSTSMLDNKFLPALDEYLLSETTKPVDSIPTKKRPPTRTKCDSPSPPSAQVLSPEELGLSYCAELMSELCRLTIEDAKESNWTAKNGFAFEGFEDICKELGQKILDQLLCELV